MKRRTFTRSRVEQKHNLVKLPCFVTRLNQLPDPLPPDVIKAYLGRESSSGRAVLLIPVNKLNSVPKSFRHRVQAVMPFWEPTCEPLLLLHPNGRCYLVDNSKPTGY